MDAQKVDLYLMTNQKYFPAERIPLLKEKLMSLPEDREIMVTATELKDPTTLLLISIFLGSMGVLKLLTGGVCGVLTIIDWFTVQNKTKELNFNRLMQLM